MLSLGRPVKLHRNVGLPRDEILRDVSTRFVTGQECYHKAETHLKAGIHPSGDENFVDVITCLVIVCHVV